MQGKRENGEGNRRSTHLEGNIEREISEQQKGENQEKKVSAIEDEVKREHKE